MKEYLPSNKGIFRKEGFNVFVADDGKIALEIFENQDIHLIILI